MKDTFSPSIRGAITPPASSSFLAPIVISSEKEAKGRLALAHYSPPSRSLEAHLNSLARKGEAVKRREKGGKWDGWVFIIKYLRA